MQNDEMANEPSDRDMIVGLAHVAGFANACERKSNEQVFRVLEEFYELVGEIVHSAGGTVVKFMGDAVLLVFAADHATTAMDSLRSLRAQAQPHWTAFDDACHIQAKAHLGPVSCGALGVRGDKRFDVVGTTVNDLVRMPWGKLAISDELRARLVPDASPDGGDHPL
jgi:adenylate cyclase